MSKKAKPNHMLTAFLSVSASAAIFSGYFTYTYFYPTQISYVREEALLHGETPTSGNSKQIKLLDKVAYDKKMLELANLPPVSANSASSTAKVSKWPVKGPYPLGGALLPFNRIVAYYGNFYSTKMGILGEYPPKEMLSRLEKEVQAWKQADPFTPVIPAIHYIVTVAQGSAGQDGDYTARMPDTEIQKAIDIAQQAHGIVFLDVQAGQSSIEKEVAAIMPYMKQPQIHLGIDPEFAMKDGKKPGEYIGTLDAADINKVIIMLSKVVDENDIPPKILVIHRFTENMVTNYHLIRPTKEVQVVMNMDGWGTQALKTGIYRQVITNEPVEFTGIKLFYKNDLKAPSTGMLTPEQILRFTPQPSYVQYQ